MKFKTQAGLLITFECAKCRNPCEVRKDRRGKWGRAFCDQCGAAYSLHIDTGNTSQIGRLTFGEKRFPNPRLSFRQRVGAFIRNR